MHNPLKMIIPLLASFCVAFTPQGNEEIKTEYFYKLHFLKNSSEPRYVKVIRIDNKKRSNYIIEQGHLLTYKNRGARSVHVTGDFSNWQQVPMNKGKYGVWYYILNKYGNKEKVRYKFQVDGIWIDDPRNYNRVDDNSGGSVSLVYSHGRAVNRYQPYEILDDNMVKFTIYKPKARFISIVGDFNNWNPENDYLKQDSQGTWKITKKLYTGTHRYKYVIDGKWVPDNFNSNSASDNMGGICSLILVR